MFVVGIGQVHFPRERDFDFAFFFVLGADFARRVAPAFADLAFFARCRRGFMPSPLAITTRPSSFHSAATLRRSSPGASIGVSRMKVRAASSGWFKMRPKASRPIL